MYYGALAQTGVNTHYINVFCAVGGVTNILTTELFTQTDRPAAYMIGGSINWISFFFIGMIFPFIVVYTYAFFPLEKCIWLVFLSDTGLDKFTQKSGATLCIMN